MNWQFYIAIFIVCIVKKIPCFDNKKVDAWKLINIKSNNYIAVLKK